MSGKRGHRAHVDESAISSVNWAEMVQKSIAGGVDVDGLREEVEALGLSIFPFTSLQGG